MSKQLKEFQELMHWTNEEMIAQFCWALCVESKLVAEYCEAEMEEMYLDMLNDMNETQLSCKH